MPPDDPAEELLGLEAAAATKLYDPATNSLITHAITGALSTVADAPAKAVLTSIVNGLVATGLFTNGTT